MDELPSHKHMTAPDELSSRINGILGSASQHVARSVNSAQVLANWLIGREIVVEQQEGKERAVYGDKVVPELAKKLKAGGIKGYSVTNLKLCRQFHLEYPDLLDGQISHTLCDQFRLKPILHTLCGESSLAPNPIHHPPIDESPKTNQIKDLKIGHALRDQFKSGHFTPNISWTDYRTLLKASSPEARSFYEIETLRHSWSARELDRQISYTIYDRERRAPDDNPTLGLILATDKNDPMVRYTLAEGQQNIFTSRYQLHLPTEARLEAEIQRELRELS